MKSESISHLIVSDSLWPLDCGPPGSSVYEISQARILEWVVIPFSRGSFWPRDQIQVSYIVRSFFTICNPIKLIKKHLGKSSDLRYPL